MNIINKFFIKLFYGEEGVRKLTKKDKTYAQLELEFFMRGRGATGRFVRKGERFRRPYKQREKLKVGETETVASWGEVSKDE